MPDNTDLLWFKLDITYLYLSPKGHQLKQLMEFKTKSFTHGLKMGVNFWLIQIFLIEWQNTDPAFTWKSKF